LISLGTSLHNEKNSNKENAEGLRERGESDKTSDLEYSGSVLSAGRYILMWGYKFPTLNGKYNPREDQMVCCVSNPVLGRRSEFASKAASVSSYWDEQLKRRLTAEIWTKTVLDRTCAFLTVDISEADKEV